MVLVSGRHFVEQPIRDELPFYTLAHRISANVGPAMQIIKDEELPEL